MMGELSSATKVSEELTCVVYDEGASVVVFKRTIFLLN